jgi:hypothetical protein
MEVAQLAEDGRVEDAITFGPTKLVYALALGDALAATYEASRILVTVPSERGRAWADSDEVGIERDDGALRILIEKDFACLKPRSGEDDADAFPNPQTGNSD